MKTLNLVASFGAITAYGYYSIRSQAQKQQRDSSKKTQKVGVNGKFLEQIKKLLPIIFPSVFSKESGLLVSLASILIVRTWLDIWFSSFNGKVVKSIVSRDKA